MKRFYELAGRLSAQAGVVAMLVGLMLAGSSQALADQNPAPTCANACNSGAPNDEPPCSTRGGTCTLAAGAPAGTVCACGFLTYVNEATGAVTCTAICG